MTQPAPGDSADQLVQEIVTFADTCEQAEVQDATTRTQALTSQARRIVTAAHNWINNSTPLPSGS
jgi:hypothetical protein